MTAKFSKGDRVRVLPLTVDMFKAGTKVQELINTPIWKKAIEHEDWEGVVETADNNTSYIRFESGEGCLTYNFALEEIKEKKYVLYRIKCGCEKERLCALDSIAEAKFELYSHVKTHVDARLADFRDVNVEFDHDDRRAMIKLDAAYYIVEEEV